MLRSKDSTTPLMLLLSLGVLLPTACIFWFMLEAVNNERLAARQKLREAYSLQIEIIAQQFVQGWQARLRPRFRVGASAAQQFYTVVNNNIASAAIVLDSKGEPAYPNKYTSKYPRKINTAYQRPSKQYLEAEGLEFQQQDYSASYQAYLSLANNKDADIKSQALLGMARSLGKMGEQQQAIQTLRELVAAKSAHNARDRQGRNIQLNASYMLLTSYAELLTNELKLQLHQQLVSRLNTYGQTHIVSQQRLNLMALLAAGKASNEFPTYPAERLANNYVQQYRAIPAPRVLEKSSLAEVYHLAADKGLILLLHSQFIDTQFGIFKNKLNLGSELSLALLAPGQSLSKGERAVTFSLSGHWQNWQLALVFSDDEPHNQVADKQIAAYLWAGLLIVVALVILGGFTANTVLRQVRNNRLKNDLIATVSHELKTPLASMRVLVDTLLLSEKKYDATTTDYLKLIAQENTRLSQLIDNFLTFSRMEKGKQVFDIKPCSPQAIIEDVVDATAESLRVKGFKVEVNCPDNLPEIAADRQMLVTAILNLMENAQKYSLDTQYIALEAALSNNYVCFMVRDKGIGIEKKKLKKIFERFYRIDNRLSRTTEGCGIGLNIVEFIARAHGGQIAVASQLKRGSMFTLSVPAGDMPLLQPH